MNRSVRMEMEGKRERERAREKIRERKSGWRGRLGWRRLGRREGENARVAPLVKEK